MSKMRQCAPLFSSTEAEPVKTCKYCNKPYRHGVDDFCSTAHELRYIADHDTKVVAHRAPAPSLPTHQYGSLESNERLPWPKDYSRTGEGDAYRRRV